MTRRKYETSGITYNGLMFLLWLAAYFAFLAILAAIDWLGMNG